jgi:hypothetical protein
MQTITKKRTESTDWAQVAAMAAGGGLKVGDEIHDELTTGERITYAVAHITEKEVLFVSKNCMEQRVEWNESGYNTGGFKESDLCRYLNEVVWNILPEELKAVISERECLQIVDGKEERYPLKLWLPTEYEVFADDWASEAKEGQQFEIFKDPRNRVKLAGEEGGRATWWLLSVCAGSSANACGVNHNGYANYNSCSAALRVPVCFKIKVNQ